MGTELSVGWVAIIAILVGAMAFMAGFLYGFVKGVKSAMRKIVSALESAVNSVNKLTERETNV
jgi:hypothetical protein